jgi:hypothetical protein
MHALNQNNLSTFNILQLQLNYTKCVLEKGRIFVLISHRLTQIFVAELAGLFIDSNDR